MTTRLLLPATLPLLSERGVTKCGNAGAIPTFRDTSFAGEAGVGGRRPGAASAPAARM